jgi:ribose/xylose/arabinose/galactoside ABC-type transport system permease subunit
MTAVAAQTQAERRIGRVRVATYLFVGLVFVFVIAAAVTTDGFLTMTNFRAILSQSAYVGVFAVATALIMISGSLFSLSIGISGAITASFALFLVGNGAPIAIIATILLGSVIFAIQGFLIGAFGANPIIVSIAAGGLQAGVFLWLSGGATIVPPPGDATFSFLTSLVTVPVIGNLPVAVFVLVGMVILLEMMMRFTRFGTLLYLIGENRVAARAAGLPVVWVITGAFAVAGICVGIVGVELGAFNGSGSLLVESTFTYDAIAAAVVGGIAVTGGRGSVWQAAAGAVFVQGVAGILLLRDYSTGWQILVKGLIVLIAVILVQLNSRRAEQ